MAAAAATAVVHLHGIPRGSSLATAAQPISPFLRCVLSAPFDSFVESRHLRYRLIARNLLRYGSGKGFGYDNFGVAGENLLRRAYLMQAGQSNFGVGFERGLIGGRFCAPARAAVLYEYVFNEKWLDPMGIPLIHILRIYELRRQWIGVVGMVILSGVLTCRYVGGLAACLTVSTTILLFLVMDRETLSPIYAKACEKIRTLVNPILKSTRDLQKIILAWILSYVSVLKARKQTPTNKSSRRNLDAWDLRAGSEACADDLVRDCKPGSEMVVTDIADSVAHLMSIIANLDSEVLTADVRSLSGVITGIEDLRRDLQSMEGVLSAKESLLQSKLNIMAPQNSVSGFSQVFEISSGHHDGVKALPASSLVDCVLPTGLVEGTSMPAFNPSKSEDFRQKSPQLATNCAPAEEPSKSLSGQVQEFSTHSKEPFPPLVSVADTIPDSVSYEGHEAPGADRIRLGENGRNYSNDMENAGGSWEEWKNERIPPEVMTSITQPHNKLLGPPEVLSSTAASSPFNSSLVEDFVSPSSQSSENDHHIVEVQSLRKCTSPDPWLNDVTQGEVLGDGDRAATGSGKKRNDETELLDLVLIVGQNSKANPRKDGLGNGRGIHSYSSVDFWGKTAGSVTKTEQRGTLTKRSATGRGSFGSLDDLDDDRPTELGRKVTDEEQRRLLRQDLPSRAGLPPGVSGRKARRDDQELWWNEPAANDYERGKADGRPQNLGKGVRDLDMTNMDRETWRDGRMSQSGDIPDERRDSLYPASDETSPQDQISPRSLRNVPPKSLERGESTIQGIDETSFRREKTDVNEDNSGERNRTWGAPQSSDRQFDRASGSGSQSKRRTPDSFNSPMQTEVENVSVPQPKQPQTAKFERYLDEGESLLNEGMQGLEGRIEVGVAERMLYEASKAFESAAEINPANLSAVGLWGNSLLVHGQLKLKLSQQLRSMLPSSHSGSGFAVAKGDMVSEDERESLELTLQEVCEECEELLVDAGRKYRRALSIDKSDVRALYNWGLALCYRGELIAEEGGERTMQDADKVYLAAIDKFEAMLGISKDYGASGTAALLNWGLAMRDRSRLRPMGDKQRFQLLLQAKELFKDAVRLDPTYGQARGAVAACAAELAELEGFEDLQRKQNSKQKLTRNWWQRDI